MMPDDLVGAVLRCILVGLGFGAGAIGLWVLIGRQTTPEKDGQ